MYSPEELDARIKDVELIRSKYPEEKAVEILKEVAQDLLKEFDAHIEMHRYKYRSIKDFYSRKAYYLDVLQKRELGYEVSKKRLEDFLNKPKIRQYESWVNEYTVTRMKELGFKEYMKRELLWGVII